MCPLRKKHKRYGEGNYYSGERSVHCVIVPSTPLNIKLPVGRRKIKRWKKEVLGNTDRQSFHHEKGLSEMAQQLVVIEMKKWRRVGGPPLN
jgi:hypothetical protein